jgi:hypothetical protein
MVSTLFFEGALRSFARDLELSRASTGILQEIPSLYSLKPLASKNL